MRYRIATLTALLLASVTAAAPAQTGAPLNPLWHEQKIKNYLPHMTWPEVRDLLTRSDLVIIPIASLEEHGHQGPIGTDFLNGLERAKLIAQKTDVLVAPILFQPWRQPGDHSLRSRSDNQEMSGIAVELGEAAAPFEKTPAGTEPREFDRHAGVGETSSSLYLTPSLVDMRNGRTVPLTLSADRNGCLERSRRERGHRRAWPGRNRGLRRCSRGVHRALEAAAAAWPEVI